jgi:hypothetical protein
MHGTAVSTTVLKPLATTSMPIGHPDPNRHDNFRHPDRPRDERGDFREGFRRGYQMVYDHDWHHDHDGPR